MAQAFYSSDIHFDFPKGFELQRQIDGNGNEQYIILGPDLGKNRFVCRFNVHDYDFDDQFGDTDPGKLLKAIAAELKLTRWLTLANWPQSVAAYGFEVRRSGAMDESLTPLTVLVRLKGREVAQFATVYKKHECGTYSRKDHFAHMLTTVKAMRYKDDALPLSQWSAETFFRSFSCMYYVNEQDPATLIVGTYPEKSQFAHYGSQLNSSHAEVSEPVGIDTACVPLESMVEIDYPKDGDAMPYFHICCMDQGDSQLEICARELQPLFRVESRAFRSDNDRECEIEEGYLRKAYLLHALRSFGWTVTEHCKSQMIEPGDVSLEMLHECVAKSRKKEWLNYCSNRCEGLCAGPDMNVFYVPQGVSPEDKWKLQYGQLDVGQNEKTAVFFSYEDEALPNVQSLDELRKNLGYLYPAIKILWDDLYSARDYSEALEGDAADVVFAWCVLALAARRPFALKPGPSQCSFVQKDTSANQSLYSALYGNAPGNSAKGTVHFFSGLMTVGTEVRGYFGTKTRITLPNWVTAIGDRAFSNCTCLREICIPEGVTRIGDSAFFVCTSLVEVHLPESVTRIGAMAFSDCTSLAEIHLPEGVTEIGDWAFSDCKSLAEIHVPTGVTEIGDWVFSGCRSLAEIHIPDGLIEIGQYAFFACTSLSEIYIPASVEQIGSKTFQRCERLQICCMPDSYAMQYAEANEIKYTVKENQPEATGSGDGFPEVAEPAPQV